MGQLNGALQLKPDEFKEKYGGDMPSQSQNIVFTCLAGVRSKTALETAVSLGYTKWAIMLIIECLFLCLFLHSLISKQNFEKDDFYIFSLEIKENDSKYGIYSICYTLRQGSSNGYSPISIWFESKFGKEKKIKSINQNAILS